MAVGGVRPAKAYAIGEVAVTDLRYGPKKIQVSWSYPPPLSSAPGYQPRIGPQGNYLDPTQVSAGYIYTRLVRTPTGMNLPFALDGSATQFNDADWQFDIRYEYHIESEHYTWDWNGQPSPNGAWTLSHEPMSWPSSFVTVRKVYPSAHQTVDTRLDLRYSTYHLQEHQFKDTPYRGGLFAGFNADGSRVARTYFKFTGLSGPLSGNGNEGLWPVGGMTVYSPRLARTGSASLLCRAAADDSWDPETLVWSNAPAVRGATGGAGNSVGAGAFTVSWDSANPIGQWVSINNLVDIDRALPGNGGSGILSPVLLAANESSTPPPLTAGPGWVYFARNQYTEPTVPDCRAFLLYAFGGTGVALDSLTLSPSAVYPDGTVTGTVTLTFDAPAGGIVVGLSSSVPGVTVPSSVTIPQGQRSASFAVDVSGVVTEDGVEGDITATLSGSRHAHLNVYGSN